MRLSAGQSGDGAAILRSTRLVAPRSRATYWRDAVASVLPSLTVDYPLDRPPRARLESHTFADAQITRFIDDTLACRVTHTPSRVHWPDAYLLALQVVGGGCYRQAGCEVTVQAGDIVLLDMSQRFELAFAKRHHELAWVLPRETLGPLLTAPQRTPAAISGRRGYGALLAAAMHTLAGEAGRMEPAEQKSLRIHLCNLAALAVGATTLTVGPARRQAYRVARRQQIYAYVEAHLRETDLCAEQAARDLKMSRRWLHQLFSEGGTSFAAWVAQRRIEECRRLLEDPQYDQLGIAEIAFQNGFNELSTFYRRFRAQYEIRPRQLRRGRGPAKGLF